MRIILDIGHSKESPGACNQNFDICEFGINERLANIIQPMFETSDKKNEILINYRSQTSSLVNQLNRKNPDYIIAMHFNAFNTKATGTEVLYWHRSEEGKRVAQIFQNKFLEHLRLPDRGVKGITDSDRGGAQVMGTIAPCIICEPLFIDNDNDAKIILEEDHRIVDAYLGALRQLVRGI